MAQPTWTDERIDEKMALIDRTFEMLRDELHGLREDDREQFTALRGEVVGMRGEVVGVGSDLARAQDRMIQIGFGLVAGLLAALLTAILALV